MFKILVADTETTGQSRKDKICELAFIQIDHDLNVVREWSSLIDPEYPISPGAMGVHGITQEAVADAPTMEEAMELILVPEQGEFDDVFLICHNIPFDKRFLSPYWGITHTLCTLKLAQRIYPDAPNHKLMTLRYHLDLEVDVGAKEAHGALADTQVLFALLKRQLKDADMDLYEAMGYHAKPELVTHMTFGKHKGKALADLPAPYVKWLFTLDNLDEGLRMSLEKL